MDCGSRGRINEVDLAHVDFTERACFQAAILTLSACDECPLTTLCIRRGTGFPASVAWSGGWGYSSGGCYSYRTNALRNPLRNKRGGCQLRRRLQVKPRKLLRGCHY